MKWKEKAKQLRTEVYALYLSLKDPRTRWYARALIFLVIAYAFSPVDLIPDFIPVLGYLDDLILIPAGIYLALKMIPVEVLDECRQKAKTETIASKSRWVIAAVIVGIWLLVLYLIIKIIWL
ncbi:MAG: DUF1232 domain-containing protein [Dehalococcoidales bacterium]|nr:DUF1232 domain-containing protein [Dehalococcoidales bacterium]